MRTMLCVQISRVICLSHGLLNLWGVLNFIWVGMLLVCVCVFMWVRRRGGEVAPCQGVMWGTGRNDGMLICAFSTSSSSRSALSLLLLTQNTLRESSNLSFFHSYLCLSSQSSKCHSSHLCQTLFFWQPLTQPISFWYSCYTLRHQLL